MYKRQAHARGASAVDVLDDFGDVATAGAIGDGRIHAGAVVVDADHGDFEPMKIGDAAEGGESVDRSAASDDGFALLGFDDAVLPAGGDVGPFADVLPVEERDVEVVGVDLLAELIDADLRIDGIFGRHLGHELIGVARDAFEGDAEHAVHVVIGVGGFKEADAMVVGVADEAIEALLAEVALDRSIVGAGTEGEARDLDAGFAEGDEVGGAAGFSGERDRA